MLVSVRCSAGSGAAANKRAHEARDSSAARMTIVLIEIPMHRPAQIAAILVRLLPMDLSLDWRCRKFGILPRCPIVRAPAPVPNGIGNIHGPAHVCAAPARAAGDSRGRIRERSPPMPGAD